jgi:hypothetical protein
MRGADVRKVFETVLPADVLGQLAEEAGFQQRERRLHSVAFLRSMMIAASRGEAGRQAAVAAAYYESGATKVVRGAFYRWFNPRLEQVMEKVSRRALEFARNQPRDLPGWLGEVVTDWILVEATQVHLEDALIDEYLGTSGQASMKLHKHFSVGVGTTIRYDMTPRKEQDITHLHLDESWRGLVLMVDLGYASKRLLNECEQYGARGQGVQLRQREGHPPLLRPRRHRQRPRQGGNRPADPICLIGAFSGRIGVDGAEAA